MRRRVTDVKSPPPLRRIPDSRLLGTEAAVSLSTQESPRPRGGHVSNDRSLDRVNDFTAVRIALASPDDVLSWSSGEVTRPDTVNYRTHRPEKGGLFCER